MTKYDKEPANMGAARKTKNEEKKQPKMHQQIITKNA